MIRDPENTIFVSAVALWEVRLKQSLGKVRLPEDFDDVLAGEPFENLSLTGVHTRAIASMPSHHRDPFDRMLVAQAQSEKFTLLTAEETLRAYGDAVMVV